MKRGKLKKSSLRREELDSSQSHKLTSASIVKPVAPFSFRVTVHENTRLREGDIVFYAGAEHIVIQVNASCARIRPVGSLGTKQVTFTPRFAEQPVEFKAPVQCAVTAISANSECEIIRRLGKNWREKISYVAKCPE